MTYGVMQFSQVFLSRCDGWSMCLLTFHNLNSDSQLSYHIFSSVPGCMASLNLQYFDLAIVLDLLRFKINDAVFMIYVGTLDILHFI